MFSFITGKVVLGVFMKLFCIGAVHETLSQIQQWCNFGIENLNLEFVFAVPTFFLAL